MNEYRDTPTQKYTRRSSFILPEYDADDEHAGSLPFSASDFALPNGESALPTDLLRRLESNMNKLKGMEIDDGMDVLCSESEGGDVLKKNTFRSRKPAKERDQTMDQEDENNFGGAESEGDNDVRVRNLEALLKKKDEEIKKLKKVNRDHVKTIAYLQSQKRVDSPATAGVFRAPNLTPCVDHSLRPKRKAEEMAIERGRKRRAVRENRVPRDYKSSARQVLKKSSGSRSAKTSPLISRTRKRLPTFEKPTGKSTTRVSDQDCEDSKMMDQDSSPEFVVEASDDGFWTSKDQTKISDSKPANTPFTQRLMDMQKYSADSGALASSSNSARGVDLLKEMKSTPANSSFTQGLPMYIQSRPFDTHVPARGLIFDSQHISRASDLVTNISPGVDSSTKLKRMNFKPTGNMILNGVMRDMQKKQEREETLASAASADNDAFKAFEDRVQKRGKRDVFEK